MFKSKAPEPPHPIPMPPLATIKCDDMTYALAEFVIRTAQKEDASPAELHEMTEIADILLANFHSGYVFKKYKK